MKKEANYKWYKIADHVSELAFNKNNLLQTEVAGKKICIAKGATLFACTAQCPHAGGLLAEGEIVNGKNIVCPIHRYKFDLENGRNVTGEGYFLKTFPVKSTADGVFVGIEERGLLSWLK